MIIIKTDKLNVVSSLEMGNMLNMLEDHPQVKKPHAPLQKQVPAHPAAPVAAPAPQVVKPQVQAPVAPVQAPVATPVAPVQAPVAAPVKSPEVSAPTEPSAVAPVQKPEEVDPMADSDPINGIFKQIASAMGIPLNAVSENKKAIDPELIKQDVPDVFLEQILGQKMGNSTVEDYLAKTLPRLEEYKNLPIDRNFLKDHIASKVKQFFTRSRQRGWDFAKYLRSSPEFFKNKAQQGVAAPGWLKELTSRIKEVNQKGIPDYVAKMFPLPPEEIMKKNPLMKRRIDAERFNEAYRHHAWEYGRTAVDEHGHPLRAGEPGTRTANAISEFNRAVNIINPNLRDKNGNPASVKPFGGYSSYGLGGKPFTDMKAALEEAVNQNEADGGQTEAKINAALAAKGEPPISLDRKRWGKGGDLYVNNEMINPHKIGRASPHYLKALQQAKNGGRQSLDQEDSEGNSLYDPTSNARDIMGEDDLEEESALSEAANPYDLIKTPFVSTGHANDLPLKKRYSYPMVAREALKHMGDTAGAVPQDEIGLRSYVRNFFNKKRNELQDEIEMLGNDPENRDAIDNAMEKLENYKNAAYQANKVPLEQLKDFAGKISKSSGLDQKVMERLVDKIHSAGITVGQLSGADQSKTFEKFVQKLRGEKPKDGVINKEDEKLKNTDDNTLRQAFDNIAKTYRNLNLRRPLNDPNMKPITSAVVNELKQKYDQQMASLASNPNKGYSQRSDEMEAKIKSLALDFTLKQLNGELPTKGNVLVEEELLKDPAIRQMLSSTYTNHELNTGKVMLSKYNDLLRQRLHHLIVDVSNEVLNDVYARGKAAKKQDGTPVLEAKTMRAIKIALFLNKNRIFGV